MGPFTAMDVTESGLTAYRLAMDVTASNVANLNSTVATGGGAYQAEEVVLSTGPSFPTELGGALSSVEGVRVSAIEAQPQNGSTPGSGSDVDLVKEMTDLLASSQAYDANVSVFTEEKAVETKAMDLGQGV